MFVKYLPAVTHVASLLDSGEKISIESNVSSLIVEEKVCA